MANSKVIRSLEDLELVAGDCAHVLTLFSGGLDSSFVLKVLEGKRCQVTALVVDLGGGVDRGALTSMAARFGADLRIVDGKQHFASSAVAPAIRANAQYLGLYPISASLSRPVMAEFALDVARTVHAEAIVHTANQSQNSLRRLNGAIEQLGYEGFYGTPYEYSAIAREEKLRELGSRGADRIRIGNVSGDANIWCREFESGTLDDPEDFVVHPDLLEWTGQNNRPTGPHIVSLTFVEGLPVALNDVALDLVQLIEKLNYIAGAHGIGRYCGLEHLQGGQKVLEVREAPAATLLLAAFRHLETAAVDAELLREKMHVEQLWVREAVEGRWFGELRPACEAFIASAAARINGRVEFRLRDGAADVCSIKAPKAKYLRNRDVWESDMARSRSSRSLIVANGASAPAI